MLKKRWEKVIFMGHYLKEFFNLFGSAENFLQKFPKKNDEITIQLKRHPDFFEVIVEFLNDSNPLNIEHNFSQCFADCESATSYMNDVKSFFHESVTSRIYSNETVIREKDLLYHLSVIKGTHNLSVSKDELYVLCKEICKIYS